MLSDLRVTGGLTIFQPNNFAPNNWLFTKDTTGNKHAGDVTCDM